MVGKIRFTKMHGCGNDYIYIDTRKYHILDPEKTAALWSNRHTGIGSDGLVLIGPSGIADCSMRVFNADGSEAMMCGNASRCVARYLYDNGEAEGDRIRLETLSGIKTLKLNIAGCTVQTVTVDMGQPVEINEVDLGNDYPFPGIAVNMGNPHLVIFVDDMASAAIHTSGPMLERHSLFPGRVNVEFAQLTGKGEIRTRVWERGSGITRACGTGACATSVAATRSGLSGRNNRIVMDGGTLLVDWDEQTGNVFMTGPATSVYTGEIEL